MAMDMFSVAEEAVEAVGPLTALATRLAEVILDQMAKVHTFEQARHVQALCESQRVFVDAMANAYELAESKPI